MHTLSIGSRCSKKKAMPAAISRQQNRKSSLSMALSQRKVSYTVRMRRSVPKSLKIRQPKSRYER